MGLQGTNGTTGYMTTGFNGTTGNKGDYRKLMGLQKTNGITGN